jgi:hypothetical protein
MVVWATSLGSRRRRFRQNCRQFPVGDSCTSSLPHTRDLGLMIGCVKGGEAITW